ncbi:C-Jun-amino-terminal kinase-interacting protein 1a [Brachionichthys hirsutus]|uniref:C-Jun-amino-terminal kinase-interacting protein 1a n=1 Tax=Brachionichthys hirsutus TaxID=412623 RepID=UPI003604C072
MDKYRPKRPTTLALFQQLPRAGTQDSINNNSLGKKDSWKDSRSSSPHITGDLTPPAGQPKAEGKVRHVTRRQAPKPPAANAAKSTAEVRPRPRDRHVSAATHAQSSQRSQRRGGGGGRGVTVMREKNLGDIRGRDGVPAGKEDRRGGRLCEESKGREKEKHAHPRLKEASGPRSRGADGKGKAGAKDGNRGLGLKPNNLLSNQEVYLTAMVVPRTPVVPRTQDKAQDPGQNHDRTQDDPHVHSRSSSEGGSNRMSLSSDNEGPPPGPVPPSVPQRINPDIREEEGEGVLTPFVNVLDGSTHCPADHAKTDTDDTEPEGKRNSPTEVDGTVGATQGGGPAAQTEPKSDAAAGLNYDSVKYTLVVDEHAQLELVSLKDCLHGYSEHNEDSDAETVYQSANEEEDPEYEEERKRREEARKQDRRKREEDVRRRREEEVKRRKEYVARVCKQYKVSLTTTSEEGDSSGGKTGAPRSRKFFNLFSSGGGPYVATGAGPFGLFSCVLDGVERQQSHRAVYRFVPRHADELCLEPDDPVLMLDQSEDLWCQGYNMRTGAAGIFPAFYAVRVAKDTSKGPDGWTEQFLVQFLGSVQVPIHQGNDVLCAAMQKVACSRRSAGLPVSACVLEVSVKAVKISVQDQCRSAHRGDQCYHYFQLKNISFCGCHPKHSKYFGFITKHPDQQRFACHVMMSATTLRPLAESLGRAFKQNYKEQIGYSCPTEDIFIE